MALTRLEEWERKLRQVFDKIDDYLEDKYGSMYPLHPARARRGRTSSKSQDGLFNVGAAYSAGFGSEYGEGYVLELRFSTLRRVPKDIRAKIKAEVVELLEKELPEKFPGKKLTVKRDGRLYKIIGDLSLG